MRSSRELDFHRSLSPSLSLIVLHEDNRRLTILQLSIENLFPLTRDILPFVHISAVWNFFQKFLLF